MWLVRWEEEKTGGKGVEKKREFGRFCFKTTVFFRTKRSKKDISKKVKNLGEQDCRILGVFMAQPKAFFLGDPV